MKRKSKYSCGKIVLLGPEGSFSDAAAHSRNIKNFAREQGLRSASSLHYVSSFTQLFAAVKKGAYGLVPLRNRILGRVPGTEPYFEQQKKWEVLKRFTMPIEFAIVASTALPLSRIEVLHASEIARLQCLRFIKTYLPHAKLLINKGATSFSFTKVVQEGGSVARVKGDARRKGPVTGRNFTPGGESQNKNSAALGSFHGAKHYKLKILARHVQDVPDDSTEFVIIKYKLNSKIRAFSIAEAMVERGDH